ncbi:MAG: ABC transporter permease [Erysipelotrichales bacterium]|nr:ABC transporter permease [Erysipelotrichales bacterium]
MSLAKVKKERTGFFERYASLISSLIAIVCGLLVALFILMVSKPSTGFNGFLMLLLGGIPYGGVKNIGDTMYLATPIMMTGVALCLAFKTGVFNIGGPGQYIVGAFGAVFTAVKFGPSLPGPLAWIVPLLVSLVLGALWALIPGLLKAYFNVNVVISTIMFNYIGMYYVVFWVKSYILDSLRGQSLPVPAVSKLPKWFLPSITNNSSADIGFFIAVIVCILVWVLLEKTTRGYEMKACGMNANATTYAGINSKQNIVFAILLSGALCGLGGGLHYLASSGVYISLVEQSAAEGFTGIAIACLANNNPIGAIFAALYMSFLTVGGQYMQLFGFQKEIVSVITGVIIYFSSFVLLLNTTIARISAKRRLKKDRMAAAAQEPAEEEKLAVETTKEDDPVQEGGENA